MKENGILELNKRKISYISISNDKLSKIQKFVEKNDLNWIFISDENCELIKKYGIYLSGKSNNHDKFQINHAIPSKSLINMNKTIVWKYIGTKTDRPTIEFILKAIEENF